MIYLCPNLTKPNKIYKIFTARARRACALRALGLLLADGVPRGGGVRLFGASDGSPHENGRNSEMKSHTVDPKVPKRSQRRGEQTLP